MVIILLILITLSVDSVWMLLGENCCWSLLALKGLMSSHNTTPSLGRSICMTTLKMLGGRGQLVNNVLYGEAPLRTNPLTLLYTIFDRKGSPSHIPSIGKMVPHSHTYNQGHSTWVTPLWYLSFSLPVLFHNGFSVELSKFEANIERDKEKEVEHNMSTIFLQVNQVLLMSQIVVKNFATLCCIRKMRSLHKTETFLSTFLQA